MFPQLFHIGKFALPTYGFLVSLGVLIGLWISVRNSERQGIDPDNAWNLGILVVLCGIIGAIIVVAVGLHLQRGARTRESEAVVDVLTQSANELAQSAKELHGTQPVGAKD